MISRTPIEIEIWKRIRLSIAAFAYEHHNTSIMSDSSFDIMCRQINLKIDTGRVDLDEWWRKNFDPDTGMWIRSHPELNKISSLYDRFFSKSPKRAEKRKKKKRADAGSSQLDLF